MGMESINRDTLVKMNKKFNKVDNYEAILGNLRRRGISYSLNFVFDGETPDVFPATLQFLHQHKVPVGHFYILEPQKGTPLYDRMSIEDRLIRNPSQAQFAIKCVIKPPYGTPEELEEHVRGMYERFFSLPSMVRRLPMPVTKAHIASWVLNFSQRKLARAERNVDNFDWL